MRIAQVAPLYESVPPKLYGGTERVVHYITEELVAQGHEVTLFASGDSLTSATLVAPCDRALRLDSRNGTDPFAALTLMAEQVAQRAERDEFDIIHLHTDHIMWPLVRRLRTPQVNTFHGRLDLRGLAPLVAEFADAPVVSISNSQRLPLPQADWRATVPHGLPEDLYQPGTGRGGYLAFLGRISPEKRPDRAIEIATRAGIPLRIAAKVDAADQEYFDQTIAPLLSNPYVDYVGEISDHEKGKFLGDAAALMFPIDWPEPFGLAMIEALACGTPVVAFRCGSVPEVLRHGVTGFIVDDVEEAVRAVNSLHLLSRADCRAEFDARFTARRMVTNYVDVFERIIAAGVLAGSQTAGHGLTVAS